MFQIEPCCCWYTGYYTLSSQVYHIKDRGQDPLRNEILKLTIPNIYKINLPPYTGLLTKDQTSETTVRKYYFLFPEIPDFIQLLSFFAKSLNNSLKFCNQGLI